MVGFYGRVTGADPGAGGGDGVARGCGAFDGDIGQAELGDFAVEAIELKAGIEYRAEYHIAADAREAVEIGDSHRGFRGGV